MEEQDIEDERLDDSHESTQYRACYIYHSSQNRGTEPPRKKRKVNGINGIATSPSNLDPDLIPGNTLQERQRNFDRFWQRKNAQFQAATNNLNNDVLSGLTNFVQASVSATEEVRLRTGLIFPGTERTVLGYVLDHLTHHLQASTVVVDLQSRHCPNLQSALKAIIKTAIVDHSGVEVYESHLSKNKGLLPLNYDLDLLELFTNQYSIQAILLSLREVELFDGHLLNELILVLSTWQSRIPFILLLEVTGAADLLEFRLSKGCIHNILAEKFDFGVVDDIRFPLLTQIQSTSDEHPQLFIGPSMISNLFDIGQSQGRTAQALIHALEYSYMSHFYTNALSDLTDKHARLNIRKVAKAIRCTGSFRSYCQSLLDRPDKPSIERVQKLLNEDDALVEEARVKIAEGQIAYREACESIAACADFYACLSQVLPELRQSKVEVVLDLYRSMEDLPNSDTMLALEKSLNGTNTSKLLDVCKAVQHSTCKAFALDAVISALEHKSHKEKVHSSEEPESSTIGVSRLAPLTPSKRTKKSGHTTAIIGESIQAVIVESLCTRLESTSVNVSGLFLNEVYILSSRAIRSKQVLESNPRTVIERALLTPGDYLGCECNVQSHSDQNTPSVEREDNFDHGQPPSASAIFTLLQEAPTNINLRDLFDAFFSRYGRSSSAASQILDQANNDVGMTKVSMVQFYRALAELRLAGLVKPSTGTQIKKRATGKNAKASTHEVDHIAKTSWLGV